MISDKTNMSNTYQAMVVKISISYNNTRYVRAHEYTQVSDGWTYTVNLGGFGSV